VAFVIAAWPLSTCPSTGTSPCTRATGATFSITTVRSTTSPGPQRVGSGRHRFQGSGDTEVLVAAIERWGLVDALGRCNGMFALALWDRQERTLKPGPDRMGEKPLYYGWSGRRFFFGSELKALRAHPISRPRSTATRSRSTCGTTVSRPLFHLPGDPEASAGTTLTLGEAQAGTPGLLPSRGPTGRWPTS